MFPFDLFKKKEQKVAGNEVNIKIKRQMAGRIPMLVAEFRAIQQRDDSFNLQLVNTDESFKEDVSIIRQPIIDNLIYKLNLTKLSKEEKSNRVKKKIIDQEKRLKNIHEGYYYPEGFSDNQKDNENIEREQINIIDEENKLAQYKVLNETVVHEGQGSYEEINKDGIREITFMYIDGILYPVFHNSTEITMYPDIASKRKHYRAEQDLIDQERKDEQQDLFGGIFGNILKILFVVLLIGNIIWANQNFQNSKELAQVYDSSYYKKILDTAQGSAIKCAYYYTNMMRDNGQLLNEIKKRLLNETAEYLQKEPETEEEKTDAQILVDLSKGLTGG